MWFFLRFKNHEYRFSNRVKATPARSTLAITVYIIVSVFFVFVLYLYLYWSSFRARRTHGNIHYTFTCTMGVFLVTGNCVYNGPLGRSLSLLSLLTLLTCSSALSSLQSFALFTGSLTHFAHSLMGQLKFLNMCSCWKCVQQERSHFHLH